MLEAARITRLAYIKEFCSFNNIARIWPCLFACTFSCINLIPDGVIPCSWENSEVNNWKTNKWNEESKNWDEKSFGLFWDAEICYRGFGRAHIEKSSWNKNRKIFCKEKETCKVNKMCIDPDSILESMLFLKINSSESLDRIPQKILVEVSYFRQS